MSLNQELAVGVHLVIIFISVCLEIYRSSLTKKANAFFIINSVLGLYLGLIPIAYITLYPYFSTTFYYTPAHIAVTDFSVDNPLFTSIVILLGYTAVVVSYFLFFKSKSTVKERNYFNSFNVVYIRLFCYVFGCFSLLALFVYVNSFGGVTEAIVSASLIRRHDGETSSFTILRYIYPLVQSVAIFFFCLFLHARKKTDLFLFFVFFIASIVFLLVNAGRSNVVVFFGVLFIGWLSYRNTFSIVKLFPFVLLGLSLALFGNEIFTLLSGEEAAFKTDFFRISLSLTRELSHVYVNLLKVDSFTLSGDTGILYFQDLLVSMLEILPGGIEKEIWQDTVNPTKLNTFNFSPPPGTGIIVDLFTYGYYQFAIFGVVFVSFIFGWFLAVLDNFFIKGDTAFHGVLLVWAGFFMMGVFTSLEIKSIILGRAAYWLPLLFFIIISKISWSKKC
ncbi:O-antigen polymerase [Motilimonas eburnea]|uniref:O-antigen polymerase n=1 Tax=Motilimonas eburnea TaxID=1737488 RepID=UPI001E2D411E|nr:O-antigen polymerase [Motilimonas eburnea]MCE2572590.1 oligosaccharide repeat unit polymerase [Motilimonas eburnea]